MRYQAPGAWRPPAPGPQHAAPWRGAPVRVHAHRALRLAAAAGAWAAGLCLVIGSTALVAGSAGGTSTTHVAPAAGVHHWSAARASSGEPAGYATWTFRGTGNRTTPQFSVKPHTPWQLRWSYQCAAGRTGELLIREGGAGSTGVSVSANGPAGSGSTRAYALTATRYLVVLANCRWTVQVSGTR